MKQTEQIADSYRAATVKGAWYGPSLAELIAEISPEAATKALISKAHSVSELLQHLLLWNESRDQMEDRIRNFPMEDLGKQVPGRNYPYEFLLRGSVEHVIYHSGQIAMVLSMLRSQGK